MERKIASFKCKLKYYCMEIQGSRKFVQLEADMLISNNLEANRFFTQEVNVMSHQGLIQIVFSFSKL